MKPRIRQVRTLWHRYGHTIGLDSVDCLHALLDAGAVELVDADRYRDTPSATVSRDEYHNTVLEALRDHKARVRGNR